MLLCSDIIQSLQIKKVTNYNKNLRLKHTFWEWDLDMGQTQTGKRRGEEGRVQEGEIK